MAASSSAQILNGGFDDDGGSLENWSTFNNHNPNVIAVPVTPRSGTHVAKVFGAWNGNPNYSGLLQSVPASPGQVWSATAFVRHNSGDSLIGTANELIMKIEFYRVSGGTYGTSDMLWEGGTTILNGSSPQDSWLPRAFDATAPAETVEARITFVFVQVDNAGGASLIDDVVFEPDSGPTTIEWELIWQDEFDAPSIDTIKWRVEDLHIVKNNELQYYAPDDVYLEDGNLVLRSQQRTYQGFNSNGQWGTYQYTSGLVETWNRFSTAYGRIEVRAKLPSTQSLWPAHWMLPSSGGWPPEIDITELLGHEPTRVYMTHHWGTYPNVQSDGGSYSGPDFSQDFHTFAVEWMPGRLDWQVDGVRRFSSFVAVPQEPFYIILNTAVGGIWPGYPDGTTIFPQYHEIDYVRVYMPSDPGAPLLEIVDDTPTGGAADGVIDAEEYVGSADGINSGFGDRIGANSTLLVDSSSSGTLSLAFDSYTAWPAVSTEGVVVYIDSADGGFASTVELEDASSEGRSLASGKGPSGHRSDLFFAPGFRADYAVCFESERVSIYRLQRASHTLINGADLGADVDINGGQEVVYRLDDGSAGYRVREVELPLSHVGVQTGDSFSFVVTALDAITASRANEFMGVASGNPWDQSNPGNESAVLKLSDFIRFDTTAPATNPIPAVSDWSLLVMALLLANAGTLVMKSGRGDRLVGVSPRRNRALQRAMMRGKTGRMRT
jgi:beta-glucanase (GH16 family)